MTISAAADAQQAASSAVPHGRLLADVTLAFHPDSGHAYVPVHFAGVRDSLWFIIDVGAQPNVLTPATVALLRAHSRSEGTQGVTGLGGGGLTTDNVTVDTMRVGNLAFPNANAIAFDLVTTIHLTPRPGYPVAGILGRDFLRGHDLEFDFPNHRLRIYEIPEQAQPSGALPSLSGRGQLICMPNLVDDRGRSGEVVVSLNVNGRATHAYLDTGSPTTKLSESLAARIGLTTTSPGVHLVPGWHGGVGGEVKQYETETIRLTFANTPLRVHTTRFGAVTLPSASVAPDDQPEMLLGLYNINDRPLWLSFATNEVCVGPAPQTTSNGTSRVSSSVATRTSRPDSLADTALAVVTLAPGSGRTLEAALKAEVRKARTQGRTPFVELGAEWCIPCEEIKAQLEPPVDPGITDIFAGTYIIRLDIDKWDEKQQQALGLVSPHGIPAFFAVNSDGVATAMMVGEEWGDNNVSGLQPLKQFFRQHPFSEKGTSAGRQKKRSTPTVSKFRSSLWEDVRSLQEKSSAGDGVSCSIRAHRTCFAQLATTLIEGVTKSVAQDTVPTDTTTSPISPELLTQWIALHAALAAVPDSVRASAPSHYVAAFGGKGGADQFSVQLQDFGALAGNHPAVAAAFTRAGIRPLDYIPLGAQFIRPLLIKRTRELMADKIAGQTPPPGWPHTPPDTTLEHNLAVVGPAESKLAAAGFVLPLPADKLENRGRGIGERIPDLTAIHWLNPTKERSAPGPVSFGDGRIYLLDFSAPWCAMCPATYAPVSNLAARYADRNVQVYVVTSGEMNELSEYFRRHDVKLPVLVEQTAANNAAMIQDWERLHLDILPSILLIDGKGVIRYRVTGTYGNEKALTHALAAGIDTLLREKSGNAADTAHARSTSLITIPFDTVQGLAMVNAEVDGHRGRFVIDLATPVVLLNRAHLQPNVSGGLDTVLVPLDSAAVAAIAAARTGPSWSPGQVTINLGEHTIRASESVVPTFPIVGMQYDLSPVEQYLNTQFLGLIGIPAVLNYETIIDFTRRRLTLVPVDSAGQRLVAAPDYNPRSSVPIMFDQKKAHWYVAGSVGGLADTLQLDTGNNRNQLNAKTQAKISAHVKATGRSKLQDFKQEPEVILDTLKVGDGTYTHVPFYVSDAENGREDTLGNSFFSSFGVIGFNMRAGRMIFYK